MKFVVAAIVACLVGYASGLQCLTCEGNSIAECDKNAVMTTCFSNQDSCETIVRRYGLNNRAQHKVVKQCKQAQACMTNQNQNNHPSGPSFQCNSDQPNSVCSCCCSDDGCNRGDLDCVIAPGTCKRHRTVFPHGDYSCSNDNLEGSVCDFRCTSPTYAIFPVGNQTTTCLDDGKWSQPPPCCARPCPPYFLYDSVFLHHSTHVESKNMQIEYGFASAQNSVIGPDALQISVMYFSGEPSAQSVVPFKEWTDDVDALKQLLEANFFPHMTNTADGKVNIGAALLFANNSVMTVENGVRDNRVPKMLVINTDANSDDNAIAIARQLRREGKLIYVNVIQPPTGALDMNQFYDIAGERDHVFEVQGGATEQINKFMADIISHFCQNPCDHVLHDHV
uniref:VWFA domain-containing protein n=2 Tax=Ciona savignyi TaxID=51511 RepID=H2YTD1_CIOSA